MKRLAKKLLSIKYRQSTNHSKPMSNFRVSVVVPNYNYAQYIVQRIDSILDQTYPIYELIVLDDCSTDDSEVLIKDKLSNVSIKTTFVRNSKNSGCVFNQWKKGFELATGDYVWIAEADDLCNKNFLRAAMRGFEDDKDTVLSYTESRAMDKNGRFSAYDLRKWAAFNNIDHWSNNYIVNGRDELANYLVINNSIINVSAVVFKKRKDIPFGEFLKEAANFKLAGDWYFYSRVLLYGKISYNAEALNYFRLHENSVTKTTSGEKHYEEILKVQEIISENVKISDNIKNAIQARNKKWRDDLEI